MSAHTPSSNTEKTRPMLSDAAFKAVLIGIVASAFIIPLALVALPFIEFFNGMAAQPKAKTQMTYGRTYDQSNLVGRLPVDGTIPSGYVFPLLEDVENTIESAVRVGAALRNPLPRDKANMQRGGELYDIFCIVCHGKEGSGDGPVVGADRFPAPPSLNTDQARGYADGTIYHVITRGTEKMPSYADKLTPDERWQVVHYLRALQRAMSPKPEDLEHE